MNRLGAWWVIIGLGAVSAGCGQILGIDKDYHPVDQGEGGAPASTSADGTSSAADSASASGVGGANASASSSAASSSGGGCVPQGADTICGPDGNDINCNDVVGDCDDIQTVYVGMKGVVASDCSTKAFDFRMSTVMEDIPSDFPLVSQFKTFIQKPDGPNVIELSTCAAGGGKHVVSFGTSSCLPTANEYRSLGYVSMKPGNGYEQLFQASVMGTTTALPASANDPGNLVCCHTTCLSVPYYVLK